MQKNHEKSIDKQSATSVEIMWIDNSNPKYVTSNVYS